MPTALSADPCYTSDNVTRDEDTFLGRAERGARRALERLGEALEKKLPLSGSATEDRLNVDELTRLIEQTIESNVRQDQAGRHMAPNRLTVLLTYEERGRLGERQLLELLRELENSACDFIANRRYETTGPVMLDFGCDFLARATQVKAGFEAAPESALSDQFSSKVIELQSGDGRAYRVDLAPDGSPAYVGRAAGNAVHLEDSSVSRFHCSLSLGPHGDILVADLGSSNGTRVNEMIVNSSEVRVVNPGDCIAVGDVRLLMRILPD